MEKPYNKTGATTKNWVKEAGLVKPSPTFSMDVLQKIEAVAEKQQSTPLISGVGWIFVMSVILGSVVILYIYPPKLSILNNVAELSMQKWKESISALKISDSSFYAFVFLSLFLLQLPFLKKLLDKQLE